MAKITCYTGMMGSFTNFLYNPQSKKVIEIGEVDDLTLSAKEVFPSLTGDAYNIYKQFGTPIKVEESLFNNFYDKLKQIKSLEEDTSKLAKSILPTLRQIVTKNKKKA